METISQENLNSIDTEEMRNLMDWVPSCEVKIGKQLTEEQIVQLKELIEKYKDIFSTGDEDIGEAKFKHDIEIDPDKLPKRPRFYATPYAQRGVVESHINKMLRMKVIERSEGEFSSPIVLVKKPDGSERFCVDFRDVNSATVKDNYPMPLIQEKLDSLAGCNYFTLLDMTAGY
jgi:hypothetical protein